jgi:hypothetical protein
MNAKKKTFLAAIVLKGYLPKIRQAVRKILYLKRRTILNLFAITSSLINMIKAATMIEDEMIKTPIYGSIPIDLCECIHSLIECISLKLL